MADQNESWILHHILDRYIGSREMVETRRKLTLVKEKITNSGYQHEFNTGSVGEGMMMEGSDRDLMLVLRNVIVICPDQDTRIPPNNTDTTVFIMRDADSRPGYVTLELVKQGRYDHLYCGRGYTLLYKYQEVCVTHIRFDLSGLELCPSHLHNELSKVGLGNLFIPPLPYAVFLTFLCYHELGDTRRRDAALMHMRAVKYDEEQGCGKHWIVNNLLGICYEMVGDTRRALREYTDSLGGQRPSQYENPAMRRIERLQHLLQRKTDEY